MTDPVISREGNQYNLHQEQTLPVPRRQAFEFFSEPENLEDLTPARLSFQVDKANPLPIEEGTTIHYRLKIWGFPVEWISEITEWNPPHRFTDLMRKGPYKRWEHRHGFEDTGESETLITDDVNYQLPLGRFGRISAGLIVRWDITSIFRYRAQQLHQLFTAKSISN